MATRCGERGEIDRKKAFAKKRENKKNDLKKKTSVEIKKTRF